MKCGKEGGRGREEEQEEEEREGGGRGKRKFLKFPQVLFFPQ